MIGKFFNSKKQKLIVCFFCYAEAPAEESFTVEYKSVDGTGTVNTCPMCAGMLDDMVKEREISYDD